MDLPETMQCLWLDQGQIGVREVRRPDPSPSETLVRVRLAGICATDLALVKGYGNFTGIPGHEFVGEIVAAPANPDRVGQRVVGSINAACGSCDTCRAGRPTHCPERTVLGIADRQGAFADYLVLPPENLYPVPEVMPDDVAVFAEPVAAALEVLEQVHVRPTHRVVVIGAGRLGQLVAQVISLTGCHLRVAAKYDAQRKALATRSIDSLPPDALPRAAADVVVEATGSPEGFALARYTVRPRGTILLKSTYPGEPPVDLSAVVVDELTVVGSRCGPFRPALRLLSAGLVEPGLLVDARYPLSAGVTAFEHAARPGAFKILLRPGE